MLAEHFSHLFKKSERDYIVDIEQSQTLDIDYSPDVEEVSTAIGQLKDGTAAVIIPEQNTLR